MASKKFGCGVQEVQAYRRGSVVEMQAYWEESELQLTEFFRQVESRGIPVLCDGTTYFVAADDVPAIEEIAAAPESGVSLAFSSGGATTDTARFDGTDTTTREIVCFVERACDGRFSYGRYDEDGRFVADRRAQDGVWCLDGPFVGWRYDDTTGAHWETEDVEAPNYRTAAVSAFEYLKSLSNAKACP